MRTYPEHIVWLAATASFVVAAITFWALRGLNERKSESGQLAKFHDNKPIQTNK